MWGDRLSEIQLKRVWNQQKLPVLLRRKQGKLGLRIPYHAKTLFGSAAPSTGFEGRAIRYLGGLSANDTGKYQRPGSMKSLFSCLIISAERTLFSLIKSKRSAPSDAGRLRDTIVNAPAWGRTMGKANMIAGLKCLTPSPPAGVIQKWPAC